MRMRKKIAETGATSYYSMNCVWYFIKTSGGVCITHFTRTWQIHCSYKYFLLTYIRMAHVNVMMWVGGHCGNWRLNAPPKHIHI